MINTSLYRAAATKLAAIIALLVVPAGCGAPAPAVPTNTVTSQASAIAGGPGEGELHVVATTTQIRSMAEAVAGDLAVVRSILPPGADAHDFEPKPSDVQAISESALALKNGLGLDDWVDKLISNAGGRRPLVTASAGAKLRQGDEEDPEGDPHIWLDVTNAMTMTRNIRDALAEVDAAHAAAYRANADAYLAKLEELDRYIMDRVATLPAEQRKIVTNHDAFGYFIDRYGLTFVGSIIPSMSSEAQPSASDVAELITKLKDEKVKAIFLESSINPKLAQQIGKDAGVKVVGTLYGDTLGGPGSPGETYLGMMKYNADTIVEALK